MPTFIYTCMPQRRASCCKDFKRDELEESRDMTGPPTQNVPSLQSPSSYSSLCDDELLLTPPANVEELEEGDAVDSICLKPAEQDLDWLRRALGSKPPVFLLIHKGRVIACLDDLDSLQPYTKPEATWAGGMGRWERPVGNGSVGFDVQGWCIARDRHEIAAAAGEKTYTPRPRHFWRKLRIINYLFWLSAFLALAGYSFQLVNLFADTVCEQVRVALVFYFIVSTSIFTMGFP